MIQATLAFPKRVSFAHRNLMDIGAWQCVLVFGAYPCLIGYSFITPLIYLGCGIYLLGVGSALYQRPANDFRYGMEIEQAVSLWRKGQQNESPFMQSRDAYFMAWFYLLPGLLAAAIWAYFHWPLVCR